MCVEPYACLYYLQLGGLPSPAFLFWPVKDVAWIGTSGLVLVLGASVAWQRAHPKLCVASIHARALQHQSGAQHTSPSPCLANRLLLTGFFLLTEEVWVVYIILMCLPTMCHPDTRAGLWIHSGPLVTTPKGLKLGFGKGYQERCAQLVLYNCSTC
jgi:hypothetical protein